MKTATRLVLAIFSIFSLFSYADSPVMDYLVNVELENESSGMYLVDCVYVINLERRPEKWARAKYFLNSYFIYPNRVNAFDGWLLTDIEKERLRGHYSDRLRGGQIGCIVSHLSAIKDAYDRGFNCIWVCEDDIFIYENPHELSVILFKLESLIPDWDVLYTDIDAKHPDGTRVPSVS